MFKKFFQSNSNGFTLIEIIASIAILAMVIAVFLPIFPQIMGWTEKTDDELVASNLLSKVANEVKNIDVDKLIGEEIDNCNDYLEEDRFFKKYPLNGENYDVNLNVCKENDVNLYRTHIKIYSTGVGSNDGRLISESYTYIEGEPQ